MGTPEDAPIPKQPASPDLRHAPIVVLRSRAESRFKYDDYFLGTGRSDYPIYETIYEAVNGESPKAPVFSEEEMFAAFPFELFGCN